MKKLVSALLIMLMLVQTVSFAAVDKVYTEDSTKQLVDRLSTLGIFSEFDDDFFFGDNANIKRSEAAVVISNMLGMKNSGASGTAEVKFFDVPQYSDYIGAVNYVTSLGIMSANGAGLFQPEDSMEIAHIIKALVVALGYGWKAEAYGGYPAGYVKVAAELELTDGMTKGMNDAASRVDFLNMVNSALDVPICRMKSVSGDVMDFEVDEDVTVLSEYHNIYYDEAVVENDKAMALSSSIKIEDDIVYIGGRKLYVGDVTEVYSYFGKKVEYYYRHDKKAETNHLIAVTPAKENVEIKIAKADFDGFRDGKITYYNEDSKKKDVKLSTSAAVFYNGEVVTNVADAINSFEGTLTLIDNNDDKMAEIVIAKNYEYDIVSSVKVAENKIYAKNKVFDLEPYESVSINVADTGDAITIESIMAGNIIGYAISSDGTKLMMDVLIAGPTVKITTLSGNKFTTEDGIEYNTDLLSVEQKALIKTNAAVAITAIDGNYAVWAVAASEAAASLGYLINIATETEFNQTTILGARILDTGGSIKAFKSANPKKLNLNGTMLTANALVDELARIKAEYQLGGDGRISQLVAFRLNDNGDLTHIYTVSEEEDCQIYLKYGYGRDGLADMYSNAAYSLIRYNASGTAYEGKITGVHGYYTQRYMLVNTHPLFRVPMVNQETSGEEWYTVTKVNKDRFEGTPDMAIESFTSDEFGILPRAAVEYSSSTTEQMDVVKLGDLVLIDSTYQNLNSDDGVDYVVNGLCGGKSISYIVDSTEVNVDTIDLMKAIDGSADEEAGFTRGDIAMIQINALNNIIQIAKIYDHETGNIHPRLAPEASSGGTAADQVCALIIHPYNKPDDGYGLEFFEEDLSLGVPSKDRMLMISLHTLGAGKVNDKAMTFKFYDGAKDTVYLGSTQDIVDYRHDKENYTKIFYLHMNSAANVVFYNY